MRGLAFALFLVFIGFLFWARHYYICDVKQLCTEEVIPDENLRLQTLELKDDGVVLLKGYDQFVFATNDITPELNDNNKLFLDSLVTILKADSAKNLTITAFYRESEIDIQTGFFENMGIARADAVRKLLIERGIDESRISLDHGISEDDDLQEPLLFDLYLAADLAEEYDKVLFSFTNMTFSDANFKSDSDEFQPGESFHLYADSLKTYFEENTDKNLIIIGHTDNIGEKKYNLKLGERRAESTLEYLRELGITVGIETDSKGERRPVTSNKSRAGRQKNRRVNFVIE